MGVGVQCTLLACREPRLPIVKLLETQHILVMASPVAITIESEDRAGFGSSLNSQRSYGTVKVSSAAFTSAGRLGSYVMHTVHEEDTLQGLALKYNVSVSTIRGLVST